MNTLSILKDARALITSPDNWTQGASANTADMVAVEPCDPRAVRFCSIGAMVKATGGVGQYDNYAQYEQAYEALREVIPVDFVSEWNDNATHEDVLAAFDRAIAYEEVRS